MHLGAHHSLTHSLTHTYSLSHHRMLLITFPLLAVLLLVAAAPSGAVKCPSVAFVVHSNARNDHITDFMSSTFLKDTNLVVVSGHDTFDTVVEHRRHKKKRRNLRRVIYNGNPGGRQTFRTGGGNYLGTHRTLAGVLMAMDLHPEVDWVYVMDDDNVVNVDQICDRLSTENASIPLLLGSVGKCVCMYVCVCASVCTSDSIPCIVTGYI